MSDAALSLVAAGAAIVSGLTGLVAGFLFSEGARQWVGRREPGVGLTMMALAVIPGAVAIAFFQISASIWQLIEPR